MGCPLVPLLLVQDVEGFGASQASGGWRSASGATQAWGSGCQCGLSTSHQHTVMCPSRAQPPRYAMGHSWHLCWRTGTVWMLLWLFPPTLGQERFVQCRMLMSALLPAGMPTPPGLLWFAPGPVTPTLLSYHPGALPSIPSASVMAPPSHPTLQLPWLSPASSHRPWPQALFPWWHKVGCEGCSHRCPMMQETRQCPRGV